MAYISKDLYKDVYSFAQSEGISREDLNGTVTPDDLEHSSAFPSDQFFALHELADSKLQPGFSLRVGLATKIEDYGVLGLSWKTCSWAGEIFERCDRYFSILSDTYVFKIHKSEGFRKILLLREPYRKGVKLSNEASFAGIVSVIKKITEKEIIPYQVNFSHSIIHPLDLYRQAFQCEVNFDTQENALVYKNKDLETRTAKADRSINEYLLERVQEETEGIQLNTSKVVDDVEQLLKDALPSGIPSIAQISEYMGMSNRTLTRRLSEAGVTFRDLIKRTQEEVSINLLKNTSRNIAEIAFETGFSEQSAFNRAFKRWTGLSPVEFRKR
ncbi:helix-turn-helix domain-containing protein [Robiginitalea sp. IMCC44478]|uniref:helix-turn-helix domain-containing protein n=1 Tax=Robiginitalea sp. IMCC44478 TaxID=3459122 RepID=UPI0040413E6A